MKHFSRMGRGTGLLLGTLCPLAIVLGWGFEPSRLLAGDKKVQAVAQVDIKRYLGTWYEVASIPSFFQRGCVATVARYAMGKEGELTVQNECRKDSFEGDRQSVQGRAWQPDPSAPGKLKVSFFWPFSGDYWILELDPDYRYALVGEPERERLWILSRTPQLDESRYQNLLLAAGKQGYDVSKLVRTAQPPP